jgi:hypothetical protein
VAVKVQISDAVTNELLEQVTVLKFAGDDHRRGNRMLAAHVIVHVERKFETDEAAE